jgi:uncharacterized membrane protein
MKKYLIAIAMVLALSMNANAAAQKHRHTPRTEQVDSTKNNPDAIEAFSDTTAVSSTSDAADEDEQQVIQYSTEDARGILHEIFSGLDDTAIAGMIFAAFVLFLLFVLAPILIICAVFYFINRNRKDRIKLAQMAMEKGQPIPEDLLKEKVHNVDRADYQTGLRQMFTGVGLAIFLGIVVGDIGFGIGALVFFIGLGKWYIARQAGGMDNSSQYNNRNNDDLNKTQL